jgi:pilus assembly protein Flp/PilA
MIDRDGKTNSERGQGLIEYALILVLVAVVVIGILMLLGPTIRTAYASVITGLGSSGVIDSASAVRTGGGHGNSLVISVSVSTNTMITVTDSQGADPVTVACNGSCTINVGGAGDNAGTVVITAAAGGVVNAPYPVKL